jgi:hypothetical protein
MAFLLANRGLDIEYGCPILGNKKNKIFWSKLTTKLRKFFLPWDFETLQSFKLP